MGMLSVLTPFARSSFRKRIGNYHYKIGGEHKKPGVIPLHVKNNIRKTIKNPHRAELTIKNLERKSIYPFGRFVHKSFRVESQKTPFLDIPDLSDFNLRPYVSCQRSKLPKSD